jgi:CIC family chloride channel protein
MLAIAKKSSFLPRKEVYSHVATSALTVGLGGSAGLESPIVQTGSAIGSVFSSLFPIGYRDRTLLLACGAAAGIGTAFNAPIAGVLFALEVLLVDINVSAFIPLLIAGATGALCSKIILSEGILLSFRQVTDFNYHNIPYYIILGILCGLLSVFYLKSLTRSENLFKKIFKSGAHKVIFGGALLGLLIMVFPALFGEGYSSIKSLALFNAEQLFYGSPLVGLVSHTKWILGIAVLALGIVKVFAVSITLSAGGNGGNFAPSLLVGACLGFSFAFLGDTIGLLTLPTSNFCLVAMAGVLTGIFHSPLTAIFLIAEITGGYGLMIPLMIVSALSTAVSKYLSPYSLDEAKLYQHSGSQPLTKDVHILSQLSLDGFVEKDFTAVHVDSSLRSLTDAVAHSKRNIFPILNARGTLEGIVNLEDIREIMFNTSLYDSISVSQLMQKPRVTCQIDDSMNSIMEKFDKTGVWNIPVLENGKYVGFVSKSRVFSNYRDRLK